MKILGIGTVAMDVLMEVDQLPAADGFGVINRVSYVPGGSGTNVIVQSARLGADTAYIAKLGDDAIGRDILQSLKDEGVDISGMRAKPNGTSLHTNIVIDKKGEKFILLNFGDAFAALEPAEVSEKLVRECDVLFTDFFPAAPVLQAVRLAKPLGKKIVFNMQTGMNTLGAFGTSREDVLGLLGEIDVFAPCREGLNDLFGSEDPRVILPELRRWFAGLLIVTQGSRGVMAIDEQDQIVTVPAFPIEAVDTTGAGDSFIGTFMVAFFQESQPLVQALETANASAAYTCTGLGARSSPNKMELEQWIKSNKR